jgi:hypothetical protein
MKTKQRYVRYAAFAVLAMMLTACEGPMGPEGPGTTVTITIDGTPVADDISGAISDALAGHSGGGPHTVIVTGVDLGKADHYAALLHGIAAGIPPGDIILDLSGCTGLFVDKALIPPVEKARFTALTLPSTVVFTADYGEDEGGVFSGWTNLAAITAPNLLDIGSSTFYDCTSLASVNLPLAERIGYSAFMRTALTSVSLGAATSIGGSAFSGCTSLGSVSLPAAASIGGSAFARCTSLASVSLGATPPALASWFYQSTIPANTVTITVPSGKLAAYNSAWGLGGTYSYAANSNTAKWGTNHPAITITE